MRAALLGLAVAFVAAGCMGHDSASTQPATDRNARPYTAQEFRWVERLARWDRVYGVARELADSAYYGVLDGRASMAELRGALRPLRLCAQSVREGVGEPPTDDLRAVYRRFLDACDRDRRFGLADMTALTRSADRGASRVGAFEEGDRYFRDAHRSLERRLLAFLPLPVTGGITERSRVEPRLTRVASKLALKPVEIRCWSPRDWKRAVREYEAYSGHRSDIAGFANGLTRANLAPRQCAALARLMYAGWRPTSLHGLVQAADAVELLAHETEHLLNPDATEQETECHGLQDIRRVARELGANGAYARRLARVYWKDIYPFNEPAYRTFGCENGGPYDLNATSDTWP